VTRFDDGLRGAGALGGEIIPVVLAPRDNDLASFGDEGLAEEGRARGRISVVSPIILEV
jgi:hypothetical protein